ncbi:MAG: hypothetical protein R6T78_02675 [Dehalococcoidales bacterium]
MNNGSLVKSGIALGAIAVVLILFAPTITKSNININPEPKPEQPQQETLNFRLSTDTAPGNTDEYDSHSVPIYLEREQEIALSFYAEGAPVMLRVITPADETMGYLTSTGGAGDIEDKGMGYLQKGKCFAAAEGHFQYIAPEEGYYTIDIKSTTPKGDIDVVIEYQIA